MALIDAQWATGTANYSNFIPEEWDSPPPLPTRRRPNQPVQEVAQIDNKVKSDASAGQYEDSRSSDAQSRSLTDNWSRIALSGLSDQSFTMLKRLARNEDGWCGPGSVGLSASSVSNFLDFWSLIRISAVEPEFSLAPNGFLHVEWHENWKKHLDMAFRGDGRVIYGLFDGLNVHEGADYFQALALMLMERTSKPFNWSPS